MRRLLVVGLLAAQACPHSAEVRPSSGRLSTARFGSVEDFAREARRGWPSRRYVPPTEVERAAVAGLIRSVDDSAAHLVADGFRAVEIGGGPALFGVLESETRRHGAGAYVLRPSGARLVLELPHTSTDEGTLPIGLAVFTETQAAALLMDTAHRYRGAGCVAPTSEAADDEVANPASSAAVVREPQLTPPSVAHPCASDLAHSPSTIFQAAHEALTTRPSARLVVALHGFADRSDFPHVVVSAAGTTFDVAPFVRAYRAEFPMLVIGQYPSDVGQLGGTRGVQARHLQSLGRPMMHIELSRTVRDELVQNPDARTRFARLFRSLGEWVNAVP